MALPYPTLQCLKELRLAADLTPSLIESISATRRTREGPYVTHIDTGRFRLIENKTQHEPTYAEALLLSQILLLPGIAPLIDKSGDIYALVGMLGPLREDDITNFRETRDVPLSVALRVAIAFGLDDPAELEHRACHAQVWDTISTNERGAQAGECPWCLSKGDVHLPTCLPAALYAPRDEHRVVSLSAVPTLGAPRSRGTGRYGTGLKVARARTRFTQRQVADALGLHFNTYSRIERCEEKLTEANAKAIAELFGCTVAMLHV